MTRKAVIALKDELEGDACAQKIRAPACARFQTVGWCVIACDVM